MSGQQPEYREVDLPETMFRTTTFDDSTDEHLVRVKFTPLDEDAEDEW